MNLFRRPKTKLARADSGDQRVAQMIALHGVGAVIDVGANVGQYATRLRAAGVTVPIVSIEPGAETHATLVEAAAADPDWTIAPRMAISDARGTAVLNVNARSDMNSLKPMDEASLTVFPKAKPVTTEQVATERLDDILDDLVGPDSGPVFLKIDTQGNEAEVIRGAERVLGRIIAMQLEMSLKPLYQGEPSYLALLNELDRLGYDLHLVLPGYSSRTLGRQIQFDGLFVRR